MKKSYFYLVFLMPLFLIALSPRSQRWFLGLNVLHFLPYESSSSFILSKIFSAVACSMTMPLSLTYGAPLSSFL